MRFEIERVTPQIAAEWLARPWARQRTVSAQVVAKYARAMAEGRWQEPSLDPIGFTTDGKLANGQHRLHAIIKSAWEGDMLIAYDVPEDNFLIHDTGRHRLAAQFVHLPNAKVIAQMARLVLWYDQRHPASLRGGGTVFDNDEVLAYIDDHADALVASARDADHVRKALGLPNGIHGTVLYIARRAGADPDRIAEWLDGLATGAGLGRSDPRLTLRNRVIKDLVTRRDQVALWYLVVRAFNAFMEGRPAGHLAYDPADPIPVIKFSAHQRTARSTVRGNQQPVAAYVAQSASGKAN